jgi:hypothetical protein
MALAVAISPALPAAAGVILNPNDFTSLGAFAGGYSYVVDTSALTMASGAVSYTGVESLDGSAVFTFDDITFDAGQLMTVTGPRPFAFLSRGSATISGTINATAGRPDNNGVDIQITAVNTVSITGRLISNGGTGSTGSPGSPGGGGTDGTGGIFGDSGEQGGSANGQDNLRPEQVVGSGGQGAPGATASGGSGGYGATSPGQAASGSTGGEGGAGGGGGGGGGGADGGVGTNGLDGDAGGDGAAGGGGGTGGEITIYGGTVSLASGAVLSSAGGAGGVGGAGGEGGKGGDGA